MSAERVPDLSLEQLQETEVFYVLMPHAVRLPPPPRREIAYEVPWTSWREQVVTNLGALAYAVAFTITVALFAVGIYVLKSAVLGANDSPSPATRMTMESHSNRLPVFKDVV